MEEILYKLYKKKQIKFIENEKVKAQANTYTIKILVNEKSRYFHGKYYNKKILCFFNKFAIIEFPFDRERLFIYISDFEDITEIAADM